MIYLTGDIHGNVNRIIDFCEEYSSQKSCITITKLCKYIITIC